MEFHDMNIKATFLATIFAYEMIGKWYKCYVIPEKKNNRVGTFWRFRG